MDKGVGRHLFHLVPGLVPGGDPAAGEPGPSLGKRPPLLGSRERAAKRWLGQVRVVRNSPGQEADGRLG